jgi:Zn-dependent metalloprotease
LEQINRNGSEEQREWALATLMIDHSVRAARLQQQAVGGRRRTDPLAGLVGGQRNRTIHDAGGRESFDGLIVRKEGDSPTSDLAVDEAYDGLGATYDLYWQVYERNSIDDQGLALGAHVHYGRSYDNAFWDGHRMVFGDGDGQLFKRFTIAVDVMGHELTHGVTEDESGLNYWQQSGALNESLSDVFGSLVKQYLLGQQAAEADWLIGAGLLADGVHGVALRSMKEPGSAYDDKVLGKDPQPGHMNDYVNTLSDNGGVHINSGIPNRAFYLVATAFGGKAWERAGRIWYETLRDPATTPTTRFSTFARSTVRVAGRLYGTTGEEAAAVRDAWGTVGVSL